MTPELDARASGLRSPGDAGDGDPKPLGAPVVAGDIVLETSSTTPVVTVEVDAARQTEIRQGDSVTITMPNNTTTTGAVASRERRHDLRVRRRRRSTSSSPSTTRPSPGPSMRHRCWWRSRRPPWRTPSSFPSPRCWRWPAAATQSRSTTAPASGDRSGHAWPVRRLARTRPGDRHRAPGRPAGRGAGDMSAARSPGGPRPPTPATTVTAVRSRAARRDEDL